MVKFVSNRHPASEGSAKSKPWWSSAGRVLFVGRNFVQPVGCGRRGHGKYLDQGGGGGFSRAHGSFMLAARGCVEIDWYASWNDHWGVVAEIEVTGDPVDHRKC